MPIEPTLAEVIESAIDSRLLDLHTMVVGQVVSYNAAKQAATVRPVVNGAAPNADGSTTSEALPTISNIPVRWERAGGYYDHKPLTAGDCGMLVFSESAFAHWRATGEISDPYDITRHGMSYAYFVPGCWPDKNPLPDAPSSGEAVSIVPAGGHLRVSKAHGDAQFVALENLVKSELTKIKTHLASLVVGVAGATGPAPMGAAVTSPYPYITVGEVAATSLKSD